MVYPFVKSVKCYRVFKRGVQGAIGGGIHIYIMHIHFTKIYSVNQMLNRPSFDIVFYQILQGDI